MPYTALETEALLQNIPTQDILSAETSPHLQLADQFTTIIQFIAEQKKSMNEKTLRTTLIGTHVFFCETISQEYYVHSPEFKVGYLYSSGSPFFSFIAKGINFNDMSAQEKLFYLNKFHQFITKQAAELEALKPKPIAVKELLSNIEKLLEYLLYILTNTIEKLLNAIPTEQSISSNMDNLLEKYQEEKKIQLNNSWCSLFIYENKDHLLVAQLAKLIAGIPCDKLIPPAIMTLSHQIKLGMLLLIIETIGPTYWIRSATNSKLFDEAQKIISSKNLKPELVQESLAAFRNYISSHENRIKLNELAWEKLKDKNLLKNINTELDKICEKVKKIETRFDPACSKGSATQTLSVVGMTVGAAPGYAIGSLVGLAASEDPSLNLTKATIGAVTSNICQMANPAGYVSFVMGDIIVRSTLSRLFAKLLEKIGMGLGYGIGYGAGSLIDYSVEYSYRGFRKLSHLFLNYCDEHPTLLDEEDRKFIQCLQELPEGLFSKEKENKILHTQGIKQVDPAEPSCLSSVKCP